MLSKIWKYPTTEKDISWIKKHIEEHSIDKATYYTKVLNGISNLIKESVEEHENKWKLIWDPESLENIMKWIRFIGDNLKEAGMEDSPQFKKVVSIYQYFNKQKNIIEEHLNLPGPGRRHR
jgi:hypothetical protein